MFSNWGYVSGPRHLLSCGPPIPRLSITSTSKFVLTFSPEPFFPESIIEMSLHPSGLSKLKNYSDKLKYICLSFPIYTKKPLKNHQTYSHTPFHDSFDLWRFGLTIFYCQSLPMLPLCIRYESYCCMLSKYWIFFHNHTIITVPRLICV